MTKNLVRFYISAAAVLAAFCVIAFVVPFARTTVFWLSLAFGAKFQLIDRLSQSLEKMGKRVTVKYY